MSPGVDGNNLADAALPPTRATPKCLKGVWDNEGHSHGGYGIGVFPLLDSDGNKRVLELHFQRRTRYR